ncbi:MAG: aminodeoxychorismate synthase component I [Chlorobi bacterium]|nr:aminodeoxychorismate synthase component I [Chlorobiota bacterium]
MFLNPGTLWFETAGTGSSVSEALLFSDPLDILLLHAGRSLTGFFSLLEKKLAEGFFLAGWIGYEAGYGFEPQLLPLRPSADAGPLAWFGVYREPQRFSGDDVEAFLSRQAAFEPFSVDTLRFDCTAAGYAGVIEAIRARIAAGDVYQVNFTGRYRFSFRGSPQALFMKLRRSQPSAYTAFLNTGDRSVLSVSPELFFRCRNGLVETMPMKGTACRGADPEDDTERKHGLARCEKNRAENLMIVDLLRNDLGRICVPGSVEATDLFATETYPTLHQMVSTVRGQLRKDAGLYDIFRALFPSGSVTGAPKIRAMKLIAELETSPRGVYTGTIGFMTPGRDMTFNVAIRTVELSGNKGVYGSGSGIVWDSDPSGEFRECMLKARILGDAALRQDTPGLFETMLWAGRYLWFDEHIGRMRQSALEFGIPFDEYSARKELESLEASVLSTGTRFRVRLALSPDGSIALEHEAFIVTLPAQPLRIGLAGERITTGDRSRYHKTTSRALYNRVFRRALEEGFDEVLFLNERGEVAEAAISNIMVLSRGYYFTPPVSSGLLDGVFRSYFLRTRSNCREKVLFPHDLHAADALYVCNSLRGMRRAVFDGTVVAGNG